MPYPFVYTTVAIPAFNNTRYAPVFMKWANTKKALYMLSSRITVPTPTKWAPAPSNIEGASHQCRRSTEGAWNQFSTNLRTCQQIAMRPCHLFSHRHHFGLMPPSEWNYILHKQLTHIRREIKTNCYPQTHNPHMGRRERHRGAGSADAEGVLGHEGSPKPLIGGDHTVSIDNEKAFFSKTRLAVKPQPLQHSPRPGSLLDHP